MSRPSFRARPIDINVALAIIRDADVINSDEQVVAREVTHALKNLD
jgi:enhancer of polycomb-like protein